MSRSVIVSAVRTPFGKLNGGLAAYPATELGAIAIRAGLERAGLEGRDVDYVIMGQVLQAGAGQARRARLRSARGSRSTSRPTR
jgi:acetyl-CoA C-acetyltransferase